MSDYYLRKIKEHNDSLKQSSVLYETTKDALDKKQEQQNKEVNKIKEQENQYIDKLYTKCIKLCNKATKRGKYSCYIVLIKSNFIHDWINIKSCYDDFEWLCIKSKIYEQRLEKRLQQEGLDVRTNSYSKLRSDVMWIAWNKP